MYVGSPLPVREPTSIQQKRRKQDGYQQQTREPAAMWQHQSDNLAECQREGSVLRNDLLPAVQGSVRRMAQRDFVRSQCLEALVTVARDAKEWIAAHALKR